MIYKGIQIISLRQYTSQAQTRSNSKEGYETINNNKIEKKCTNLKEAHANINNDP